MYELEWSLKVRKLRKCDMLVKAFLRGSERLIPIGIRIWCKFAN